nr:hypothetical protein [Tanacetum cinerariifolium]
GEQAPPGGIGEAKGYPAGHALHQLATLREKLYVVGRRAGSRCGARGSKRIDDADRRLEIKRGVEILHPARVGAHGVAAGGQRGGQVERAVAGGIVQGYLGLQHRLAQAIEHFHAYNGLNRGIKTRFELRQRLAQRGHAFYRKAGNVGRVVEDAARLRLGQLRDGIDKQALLGH